MDPSGEVLQVLRELRDSLNELVLTMKANHDWSEKRYEDAKKEREPDLNLWRESTLYYIGRHERLRRVSIAAMIFLGILLPLCAVVLILGFAGVFG
ncbi:MAG: hypothetical protein HY040_00600 [Planctomycetes bacterium]|nr:hypothetical protein [Planctomycetota bacterium]